MVFSLQKKQLCDILSLMIRNLGRGLKDWMPLLRATGRDYSASYGSVAYLSYTVFMYLLVSWSDLLACKQRCFVNL